MDSSLGSRTMGRMLERSAAADVLTGAVENTLAFNPLIGLRAQDVGKAAAALVRALAVSPRDATEVLGDCAKELGQVLAGTSQAMPDAKDRRFADPAWKSNFLFRRLMQAHSVLQKGLDRLVDHSSLE